MQLESFPEAETKSNHRGYIMKSSSLLNQSQFRSVNTTLESSSASVFSYIKGINSELDPLSLQRWPLLFREDCILVLENCSEDLIAFSLKSSLKSISVVGY